VTPAFLQVEADHDEALRVAAELADLCRFPGPRLIRVCCVCGDFMGTRPCAPELDGQKTHGYCGPCGEAALAQARRVS